MVRIEHVFHAMGNTEEEFTERRARGQGISTIVEQAVWYGDKMKCRILTVLFHGTRRRDVSFEPKYLAKRQSYDVRLTCAECE